MLTRRSARADDTDFARDSHHLAYREVSERQFGAWDETLQDEFFRREWEAHPVEILEWFGERAGWAIVEDREEDVHVRELVVHPDYQRRGVGTSLLRQSMELAEARQVPVHLGTFAANMALTLYLRLGFVEIDRTDTHVVLRWQSET